MRQEANNLNAKLAEIGAELRQAREAQRLSLDDLSRTTLVHSRHLVAIEEGREEDLPEPFYVKHFIRKYASTVGLPADELANRYWNTQPLSAPPAPKSSGPELNIAWWVFPVVIGALMLGGVAAIALSHLRHHKAEVAAGSPAPERTEHPVKAVVRPAVALKPPASPSVSVATAASRSLVAALVDSTASPTPQVLSGSEISFVARTTEASWMDIVEDGREVQSDVVPAGSTRKWTARHSLVVRIGNPGFVEGTLDGHSLGALGNKESSVFVRTYLTASGAKMPLAHAPATHLAVASHSAQLHAAARSAAKPKAAKPKSAKPKTAKPKVAKPKAAKPKTAKPKAAKPVSVKVQAREGDPGAAQLAPDNSSASADWSN